MRQRLRERGFKGQEDGVLFSGSRTPERQPDEFGIHPLSKPMGNRYSSEDDNLRDPASILQALVRENGRAASRQRWKHGRQIASHAEIFALSARRGRLLRPEVFADIQAGGGEHSVIIDRGSGRVIKLTKPGLYGAQAEDAGAYLQRLALANRVFGDDLKFEGFVTLPGEQEARRLIREGLAAAGLEAEDLQK
jgi:hypothetical protein